MQERALRIAMFSDSALPVLNGVSISLQSLMTELRARGHSVHLYTVQSPGYQDPEPNVFRFRSLEFPWARGYPVAYPPYYRMLTKFRKYEYDLIHTHTPWVVGFVGMRWGESHEIPTVSTYHTLYDRYSHYIPVLPRRYLRFRIAKHTNWYYNLVDHVITPSEVSRRWLQRHSVTTPMSVIPTGIPPKRMFERSEVRQELGILPDQPLLLYVGRLAREKNLSLLFDSISLWLKKRPTGLLWLVGDGPYRDECMRMTRILGIGDRVRFVGFVERAQVDRYYAAADAFVFPSVTETQGLVVGEAMSYGIPAVVATGGGAGEYVVNGENGFVVRNDPEAFAEAIDIVLQEDLHPKLSVGALNTARGLGTVEMAGRMIEVYQSVLASKPSVRSGNGVSLV